MTFFVLPVWPSLICFSSHFYSTSLSRSGYTEHYCPSPNFRRKFQTFTVKYNVCYGIFVDIHHKIKEVPFVEISFQDGPKYIFHSGIQDLE